MNENFIKNYEYYKDISLKKKRAAFGGAARFLVYCV